MNACKNCKSYVKRWLADPLCNHPRTMWREDNVITGQTIHYLVTCWAARGQVSIGSQIVPDKDADGGCGHEGRLFEPKEAQ